MNRRMLFACSLGGAGHFNPLRPFVEASQRRVDEVLVVVPPSLQATVAASGYPYRIGEEPDAQEVKAIKDRLVRGPPDEVSGLVDRELFGRMCTAAMLPAMEKVFREWQPDHVMRESCEYASAVVAARRRVPHSLVAISLAEIEHSVLDLVKPVLAPYGTEVVEQIRASAYVTQFPASLDPSPFVNTMRYRQTVDLSTEPLPDWWSGHDAPLLYVTFGSVAGSTAIASQIYRTALEAVAGIDAIVLLTVGRRFDVTTIGPIPANVHVEPWVPQENVLAHTTTVLCHGGSGTTYGALAAGVPLVIAPLFADQLVNGPLVARAGAGLCVQPGKAAGSKAAMWSTDDAPEMAAAVTTVMTEPGYRRAAERIAAEMARAPDADTVIAGLLGRLSG